MTMIVDAEGNMKTAFDYTDLSHGNYQYKKEWKKKYLRQRVTLNSIRVIKKMKQ